MFAGLYEQLSDEVIDVTVRFKCDRVGPFESKDFEVMCLLDIKSFAATDASDNRYGQKIADSLKEMDKHLGSVVLELKELNEALGCQLNNPKDDRKVPD